MSGKMADGSRVAASIGCLAALLTFGGGTAAGKVVDLYEAQTIVTGQGEESRRLGFADCLEQVLVKVSGNPRLADDPAVAAMAGRADTFVAEFDYRDRMAGIPVHDEQGTRDRPYGENRCRTAVARARALARAPATRGRARRGAPRHDLPPRQRRRART
jgi:hypothetical protein